MPDRSSVIEHDFMAEPAEIISPWERALLAAERVKERLFRAAQALDAAALDDAVV
jgi:hypothetical protein